jgi:dipeptidyl aminopeptidase/acylaminoacyl peptidase
MRSSITGLVLCLVTGIASAANTAPPSVEAFFSYDQVSEIKISPDGKYLALVVADPKTGENSKQLLIVTTDADHKATASFGVTNYQMIADFWWTLNDRIVAATATSDTGFFENPVLDGNLYAINADGSRQKQLLPATPGTKGLTGGTAHDKSVVYFFGALHMLNDDPHYVAVYGATRGLDGGYHSVAQAYLLNVDTDDLHAILESPLQDGQFFTDDSGIVRLATGENRKTGYAQVAYRSSGDSRDWEDLSSFLGGDDPAATQSGPLGMDPDGKEVYWRGRTGTGTLGLYDLDPETKKLTGLYSDPDIDIGDLVWSFDWVKPRRIIAVDTMPGFPGVHIVDGDDPKAQILASLYQAFEGQKVEITSNTRDGSEMVVKVTGDKNPGDYYLFNAKTGQAAFLFAAKAAIDPKQMADMQPIEFKARDGLTLHGYLTVPAGSGGKNLPMIVNPHGGPHWIRDDWGWNEEAQFFASHGYAVLQVNFRGSGGYGMKFQDIGYKHWASTMQDDLADAVQWVTKQQIADPNRICIYGASYGGYAAMENAERYPDLYRCAVGYVGLYDLRTMQDSDYMHYASGEIYNQVVVGTDAAALEADSPISGADKLKASVFIAYGGQDHRVLPKNAEELMAAMDKAGKPYEKYYDPMGTHGFYKPEQRYALYTQMLAFFDKSIGPDAAKAAATAGQ